MAKIYSHSRISSFEQCPLKFKFRYIDKIRLEITQTIETHLGRTVHDTLEWLYTQVQKAKVPTIDEIITHYTQKWEENYNPEIPIIKKEFTVKDYFNKGVEFIINYYTKHQPFDDNTLETEKKIMIDLDDKGEYKIIGFIDRLSHDIEKDEYEIHDYKTANNLPMQEQVDNDRQLALYAIAIKESVGEEKKVCLTWHYLAHNKKICSNRTNEQLKQLKKDTLNKIKEIESATVFPHNKSILCNWCEYKKDVCPVWNNIVEDKETKQEELDIW
ncbi:PD-(D/E)XK nuclease family protein [Candidatus Pacearchaeota archaeon]|nr:PD-(D/E)XK nuclease family protein [Candidatus Pacearchaeota archaeon]